MVGFDVATSLRERQKEKRRVDMLVAARTLFVERGYSRTTMDAIAESAGVGVATVYTYFNSKEGVFAELARMDMSELKAEGEAALASLPPDPVVAVQALLAIYKRVHEYISYEVVREFGIGARTQGPIRDVAAWMREWQSDQIARVLEAGKVSARISGSLATRDAAQIICDLSERYYDRAVSDAQERKAWANLMRWVALLFEDWRGTAI
jgi:AcrR family transcriptional regulator